MVSRADQKEDVKETFRKLWDICLERPFNDLKVTSLQDRSQKFAHYGPRKWGGNKLGIDWTSWESKDKNWHMATLLHELSHERHGNHKKEFWSHFLDNYEIAKANRDVFVQKYDWDQVAREIVKNVNPENIDKRQMATGPMREKVSNKLGISDIEGDRYSRDRYSSNFDSQDIRTRMQSPMPSIILRQDIVLPNSYDSEFLWKRYKQLRKKGGVNSDWTIPTPAVEEEVDAVRFHPCTEEDEIIIHILIEAGHFRVTPKYNNC